MNEQRNMFDDLPRDTLRKMKKKETPNILSLILKEIMKERGLELSDIHRGTGISYSTLSDWLSGKARRQLIDEHIWKLARFLNVSIEYLCLGIGDDGPAYEEFRKDA